MAGFVFVMGNGGNATRCQDAAIGDFRFNNPNVSVAVITYGLIRIAGLTHHGAVDWKVSSIKMENGNASLFLS